MKKIFLLILIAVALTPLASEAQEYTLLEPLPCIAGTSTDKTCGPNNTTETINLNDYIGYVFKFSIALAAFLAVIMIIIGGFQYMTSETPFSKSDGKEKIWNAVTGLLMVLASYLILATIDPRLVEIKTSIDPIVIDTKDVDKFKNQLASDLRSLSIETQTKTSAFVAEKTTLQKELDELNKTLNERQQDLGAEEEEELLLEKARLEQKIRGVNVEISKSTATAIGQSTYASVYDTIKNTGGVETDASVRESNIALKKENLKAQYDAKINSVLKNSTKPEAEKLAETYILYNQKDFYIAQINEEIILDKELKLHNSFYSNDESGTVIDRRPQLEKMRSEYQANMADPENIVASGVTAAEYNLIMQARINEINRALGTPDATSSTQPTP